MRKLLLATAAVLMAGATVAMAAAPKSVDFHLTSTLAASCTIAAAVTDVSVGPLATAVGTGNFTTNCNFEDANVTVSFASANGGMYNSVEDVTKDYTIAYGSGTKLASAAKLVPLDVVSNSGPTANTDVPRSFTATLVSNIDVAGDYADTVTVSVAP